jgi:sporulation protein YlmC with PRC-barrel domain
LRNRGATAAGAGARNRQSEEAAMPYTESKRTVRTGVIGMPDVWYAPDRSRARITKAEANRKRVLALAMIVAILGLLAIVLNPKMAASQGVQLVKVDVAVVAKGYRASKLIGSGITNEKNEKIGSLDDIVIDEKQVMFAILQVGGFLGLGKHLVAVPYESLKISDDGKKIELPGATKDELKKLAEFKYQA